MVSELEEVKQVRRKEALLRDGVPEWIVSDRTDNVQALHSMANPDWAIPSMWVMSPADSCLVLGSSQDDACIDFEYAEKLDVGIARRTTGGGAVYVDPQALLWVDVFVPRGHSLWKDDINSASTWMGGVWESALGSLGVDSQMHIKPFKKDSLSDLVCFAGRAPGELMVGDKKILGISQRRTKQGVRFQCALALEWKPEKWIGLFTASSIANLQSKVFNSGRSVPLERNEVIRAFGQVLTSP